MIGFIMGDLIPLIFSIIFVFIILSFRNNTKKSFINNKIDESMFKKLRIVYNIVLVVCIFGVIQNVISLKERIDLLYYPCHEGEYSILSKEYGMKCEIINGYNVSFTKNKCKFDKKPGYSYLYDELPFDNKCEENIFNVVFKDIIVYKNGLIEMIQDNLVTTAKELEETTSMIITNNGMRLVIKYNPKDKKITYSLTSNKNTNKELSIKHIDENYFEFDKKLIKLLFDRSIEEFISINENDMIIYTLID